MYNASLGYLYASAASSGKLTWHEEEDSYWSYANNNWIYAANNAYLRTYNSTFRTYAGNSNNDLALAKKTTIPTKVYSDYMTTCPDGPATAIDNAEVEGKAVKVLRNGVLYIEKNGVRYNAMGQIIK